MPRPEKLGARQAVAELFEDLVAEIVEPGDVIAPGEGGECGARLKAFLDAAVVVRPGEVAGDAGGGNQNLKSRRAVTEWNRLPSAGA